MGKYFDESSAKQIGDRIRKSRNGHGYSLEDLAAMTGFSVNAISSIENGGDTYISHFIAICQALEIKPAEVLDFDLELKPRFELPPDRRNRALTTLRVNELWQAGFFETPRFVNSVLEEFSETYGVKPESSEISTALKKLANDGKLEFTKSGRRNLYVRRGD